MPRGLFPTATVAMTLLVLTSITVTSPDTSFETKSRGLVNATGPELGAASAGIVGGAAASVVEGALDGATSGPLLSAVLFCSERGQARQKAESTKIARPGFLIGF
jgi:hypothetical protein